jgi:hypothetical protein
MTPAEMLLLAGVALGGLAIVVMVAALAGDGESWK